MLVLFTLIQPYTSEFIDNNAAISVLIILSLLSSFIFVELSIFSLIISSCSSFDFSITLFISF